MNLLRVLIRIVNKRNWGNSTLRYDSKKKVCWSISRKGNIIKYPGLSSYGVKREVIPNG